MVMICAFLQCGSHALTAVAPNITFLIFSIGILGGQLYVFLSQISRVYFVLKFMQR